MRSQVNEAGKAVAAPDQVEAPRGNRGVVWVKRLGVAGFMFFLVKGLLWLAIPAVIAWRAAS